MSDENKGGSDLDIFEGLGKKNAPASTGAVPPPPPGSGSHVAAKKNDMKRTLLGIPGPAPGSSPAIPAAPPSVPPPLPPEELAKARASVSDLAATSQRPSAPPATLPGSAPPPPSGQVRTASGSMPALSPSKPPPPPGRGTLPSISSPPPSAASSSSPSASRIPPAPPPASTRPAPTSGSVAAAPPAAPTQPAGGLVTNGKKLDMEWDDDQEATHIFDKESKDKEKSVADASSASLTGPEAKPGERADMDSIMSQPPRTSELPAPPGATASAPPPPPPAAGSAPPPATSSASAPPAPASLSGAFASLGSNGAASSAFKAGPPPSQSMRSAPPPPPGSMRPHNPSTSTAPMPPPPPPGQTTTAPMHMPPRPMSAPPPAAAAPSVPPPSAPPAQVAAAAPQTALPPVQRAMEATAVVPRAQGGSKAPMWIGLLVAILAIGGVVTYTQMQQHGPGTLVINAADAQGKPVSGLEIYVDDAKRCDSSPCIVRDVAPGPHLVKVSAPGFDSPAPKAIGVEAQKSATLDLSLTAAKNAASTGVKVSGNQPNVKLWVDGKEIGTLPQEVKDLEAGDHKIRIAGSDRYAPMEKTVSVGKNEMVDLGNVALKVLKGKVMFQLGTPGAKVYLVASPTNRKEIPQFPIAIDFEPTDKYELVATAPGYEELRRPISFDDGIAEKSFTIELTPKGQAPSQAAAQPAAHAPTQPASGGSKAPAFLAGEGNKEPAATTAKTEPKKDAPAAAGGEAFLNINSIPPSTVVLDGKPLGPTPKLKVAVSAGSHTVLFVNAEQSLKKSITVSVGAGETKPAFAKLRE